MPVKYIKQKISLQAGAGCATASDWSESNQDDDDDEQDLLAYNSRCRESERKLYDSLGNKTSEICISLEKNLSGKK